MSSQPHTVLPRVVRRTWLPLQRVPVTSFDPELVASRPLDPLLARRNHFTLDWKRASRLDTPAAWLDEVRWPVQLEVGFEAPVRVRPERLIAHGLDLGRSEARRRTKCAIQLHRPTSAEFTFAVMTRVHQRGRRRRG